MDHELDQYLGDEKSPRPRQALMTWPALVAIGWLIYEVTAQPNLGAAIVCAKFGWNDFRAAVWLRRMDPNRRRARACFWFYLASGLWKMAITATVTIFAFAFLAANRQVQQQAPRGGVPPWFTGVFLTALMGFGLSVLTTVLALLLAWRYEVKFWLSTTVHRYRRHNTWPPYDVYNTTPNQAGRVLLTALILVMAPLTISFCVALATAMGRVGQLGVIAIVLIAMGACPVSILVLRDLLNFRFVARTPWECWGTEENRDALSVNRERSYGSLVTDN